MLNLLRPMLRETVAVAYKKTVSFARNVMLEQVRWNVRWNFENCSEIKRVRRHGYKTRISTQKGRIILMRRILKNRHVLSH